MSSFVIIDAGPSLTFYAAGKQELLHAVLKVISHELTVPEIVQEEVLNKSKRDERFKLVPTRFDGDRQAGRFTIVSDNQGAKMARVITHMQRCILKKKKGPDGKPLPISTPLTAEDLGEATVIAHAHRIAQTNQGVRVLIDEWRGQEVAKESGLSVIDSATILIKAAKLGLIADRGELRKIWEEFRELDLSLVHWDSMKRLHDRSIYGSEKLN